MRCFDLADEVLRRHELSSSIGSGSCPSDRDQVQRNAWRAAAGIDDVVRVQAVEARRREALASSGPCGREEPRAACGAGAMNSPSRSGLIFARLRFLCAPREPENSVGSRAGKPSMFSAAHSDVSPDGSAKRTADAEDCPRCDVARAYGLPAPLERRTTTRSASPCMCSAVVSAAASGVAVNCPAEARRRARGRGGSPARSRFRPPCCPASGRRAPGRRALRVRGSRPHH